MSLLLINSNSKEIPLADESVHCVVTSPPYYGLRDYGTGRWVGGDPGCEHKVRLGDSTLSSTLSGGKKTTGHQQEGYKSHCKRCGAIRADQQIGNEETPEEYIANIVEVSREIWRVLRSDGTYWLNLGDSYWASGQGYGDTKTTNKNHSGSRQRAKPKYESSLSLKPMDLVGMPWMVALALRADGWYLRSDCVWSKTNPMPGSQNNRPTMSHEYLFLLTKNGPSYRWIHRDTRKCVYKQPKPDFRWVNADGKETNIPKDKNDEEWTRFNLWEGHSYFYDRQAALEPLTDASIVRLSEPNFHNQKGGPKDPRNGGEGSRHRSSRQGLENLKKNFDKSHGGSGSGFNGHSGYYDEEGKLLVNPAGRNKWTVWTFPTVSYPGKHFATFPPALVEPCIKLGTSEMGCCPKCGAPWERVTERTPREYDESTEGQNTDDNNKPPYAKNNPHRERLRKNSNIPGRETHSMHKHRDEQGNDDYWKTSNETIGWRPACDCNAGKPTPCIVLDPFSGSGTSLQVARQLGRHGVGLDLSLKYLREEANERLQFNAMNEFVNGKKDTSDHSDLPLFRKD